jgi:hypothetical protein
MPSAAVEAALEPLPPERARDSRRVGNPELTALALTLRCLGRFLQAPKITEICINRPGAVFIESGSGWQYESAPEIDLDWCGRFA